MGDELDERFGIHLHQPKQGCMLTKLGKCSLPPTSGRAPGCARLADCALVLEDLGKCATVIRFTAGPWWCWDPAHRPRPDGDVAIGDRADHLHVRFSADNDRSESGFRLLPHDMRAMLASKATRKLIVPGEFPAPLAEKITGVIDPAMRNRGT